MTDTPPAAPPANSFTQFIPQRSAGLKLLLVCGLALLMAIPALFVFGIVQDRRMGADRALDEVSQAIGGAQSLLGPVLVLPYSRAPNPSRPNDVVYGTVIAFAETGTADADVQVTERKRGIHTIPVFDAQVTFEATFDPGATVELSNSAGVVSRQNLQPNPVTGGMRASFEFDPQGAELIEFRLRVVAGDRPLTETWIYRWTA